MLAEFNFLRVSVYVDYEAANKEIRTETFKKSLLRTAIIVANADPSNRTPKVKNKSEGTFEGTRYEYLP